MSVTTELEERAGFGKMSAKPAGRLRRAVRVSVILIDLKINDNEMQSQPGFAEFCNAGLKIKWIVYDNSKKSTRPYDGSTDASSVRTISRRHGIKSIQMMSSSMHQITSSAARQPPGWQMDMWIWSARQRGK